MNQDQLKKIAHQMVAPGKVKAATGAGVFVLGVTEQDSIINQHVSVRPVVYRLAD